MKDLIKILIALAFIAGAFVTGKYLATEKCSAKFNALDLKCQQDKKYLIQLRDSLNLTKKELVNLKALQVCDTLKTTTSRLDKNKQIE